MDTESSTAQRGKFIVFEGGDGAGKSTQVQAVQHWLAQRALPVLTTREPGGTQISEELRALVLEHGHGQIDARTEALMYAAARAAHVQQAIVPALERGQWVISDRFVDSSLAYQGVGRGLGLEAVAAINEFATGGLVPDLTVVLDLPSQAGRARRIAAGGGVEQADRLEAEPDEFHERIRHAFLDLAAAAPERYLVLDASAGIDQLKEQIAARLEQLA